MKKDASQGGVLVRKPLLYPLSYGADVSLEGSAIHERRDLHTCSTLTDNNNEATSSRRSVARPLNRSAVERFECFVSPEPMSGCHLWTGGMQSGGYGFFWSGEAMVLAHRFAYEMEHGPIAPGLHLDHAWCGNKSCCNPRHLELVTPAENTRRFRRSRDTAICGHPFSGLRPRKNRPATRFCVLCARRSA